MKELVAAVVIASSLLITLSACGTRPSSATKSAVTSVALSGPQIRKTFSGVTVKYDLREDGPGTATLHRNGRFVMVPTDAPRGVEGAWLIKKDMICTRFVRSGVARDICRKIRRFGPKTFAFYHPDGRKSGDFTIIEAREPVTGIN